MLTPTFAWRTAGQLQLRVTGDGTAADVLGIRVRLQPAGLGALFRAGPRVDGSRSRPHDGSRVFALPNVVPGEYRLQIDGSALRTILPDETILVTVRPGETAEATVPLKRAGRLTGRVADSDGGISGVEIAIYEATGEEASGFLDDAITEADGQFSAFVPGNKRISLRLSEVPAGYGAAKSGRGYGLDEVDSRIHRRGVVLVPDFVLLKPGDLSGVVVDDGKPVPGATVEVVWDAPIAQRSASSITNQRGRFRSATRPRGVRSRCWCGPATG